MFFLSYSDLGFFHSDLILAKSSTTRVYQWVRRSECDAGRANPGDLWSGTARSMGVSERYRRLDQTRRPNLWAHQAAKFIAGPLIAREILLVSARDQFFEDDHSRNDILSIVVAGSMQVAVSMLLRGNSFFDPAIVATGRHLQLLLS